MRMADSILSATIGKACGASCGTAVPLNARWTDNTCTSTRLSVPSQNGVSLFRLRQAHVEEAVGAKIMKIEDTPASAR